MNDNWWVLFESLRIRQLEIRAAFERAYPRTASARGRQVEPTPRRGEADATALGRLQPAPCC